MIDADLNSAERGSAPGGKRAAGPPPWFERLFGRDLFSPGRVFRPPWWREVLGPLVFAGLLTLLYVGGSVPAGPGGHLALAGGIGMFCGFSLQPLARRTRKARGPASQLYRIVGTAGMLVPAAGWASLAMGTFLILS